MAVFEFNTPVGIGRGEYYISNGRLEINAECPLEEGYIYRLVFCFGNKSYSAGVMMPEDKKFRLWRSLFGYDRNFWSGNDIEAYISRQKPGESRMEPLPFSYSDLIPAALLSKIDNCDLASAAGNDLLYCSHAGKTYYVFPIMPGNESRYASIFCITTPVFYNEQIYGAVISDGEALKAI